MSMVIEPERTSDHAAVRTVVGAAFADEPAVVDLVELIRASPEYVPSLALVARVDDEVVGFVMVSRAELVSESGSHRVLTLSPLAVAPAMQGRGIGSALVPAALDAAERLGGEQLVVLEGSPRYYPRFGFRDSRAFGIVIPLPEGVPPEAGMAFPLSAYDERMRGRLVYPPAFAVVNAG